jgi:hypothetical protein
MFASAMKREAAPLGDGKRNMIHRREMPEAFGQHFAGDHDFGGHDD